MWVWAMKDFTARNPSYPIRSRAYDLPITSSGALPLSNRTCHVTNILHTART